MLLSSVQPIAALYHSISQGLESPYRDTSELISSDLLDDISNLLTAVTVLLHYFTYLH